MKESLLHVAVREINIHFHSKQKCEAVCQGDGGLDVRNELWGEGGEGSRLVFFRLVVHVRRVGLQGFHVCGFWEKVRLRHLIGWIGTLS